MYVTTLYRIGDACLPPPHAGQPAPAMETSALPPPAPRQWGSALALRGWQRSRAPPLPVSLALTDSLSLPLVPIIFALSLSLSLPHIGARGLHLEAGLQEGAAFEPGDPHRQGTSARGAFPPEIIVRRLLQHNSRADMNFSNRNPQRVCTKCRNVGPTPRRWLRQRRRRPSTS